ncbi:hypothetical protein CHS0354_038755 [Potamilus streckersoni]|uniref:Uncharacterized protein n=1 Tax=Potamilus streckersoni TaxID=2493646 RepID=A0AAE0SRZ4_9BIVA|nr:hypothetical protein CHS0354_038755 [Potamilus streckersoni]
MPRLNPAKFEDNFLKDRELFEVMRSRKVYQVQFDLMRNHRKQIRAIEIAEKSYFSGYENRRVLFLQRMAEQVKQRSKIKSDTGTEEKNTREMNQKVSKLYHGTNIESLAENGNCSRRVDIAGLEHFTDTKGARISKNPGMEMKLNFNSDEFDSALRSVEYHKAAKPMKQHVGVKTNKEGKMNERYGDAKEMSDYKFETQLSKHVPKIDRKGLNEKTKCVKRSNSKKTSISLPELSIFTKPMVSMEIGGVTPDGRLILTKKDYDEYLHRFHLARDARLDRVRRKSHTLEQLVARFRLAEDVPENRFGTESTMSHSVKK